MGWWEAIILGILQGLTEFLPISSSAHLSIFGQLLFDGRDPGAAFTAVTQIGTASARVIQNAGRPGAACGATSLRLIIATIGRWIR